MRNSNTRSFPRELVAIGLAIVTTAPACTDEQFTDEDGSSAAESDTAEPTEGDVGFRIVDPTPVPAGQLLGMVRVFPPGKSCSGMLIARDTVLTAAHCFCTEDWFGDNSCVATADVKFRDDPNTPGTSLPMIAGTATIHPSYNPELPDNQFENDLAVIHLNSDAPAYVPPFEIATSNLPSGSTVRIAGFGHTGGDCEGSDGTLNYDLVTLDAYEDDGKIIRFDDLVFCNGDSGGAVLNSTGTRLHGVYSTYNWTLTHGWVNKAIAAAPYFNWIKSHTCSSSFWDVCDDKGPICQCGAGDADCDVDSDCKGSLVCKQDVGELFGYTASADVCLAPGPVEGWCTCENSGLANLCLAAVNNCSPGFAPRCSPTSGSCGGCACE